MKIALLHVNDCPNVDTARAHLHDALRQTGVDTEVSEREIATVEAAAASGMRGSPTILINGVDVDPEGGESGGSLSCRLYVNDSGYVGAPSVEQILVALASAGQAAHSAPRTA